MDEITSSLPIENQEGLYHHHHLLPHRWHFLLKQLWDEPSRFGLSASLVTASLALASFGAFLLFFRLNNRRTSSPSCSSSSSSSPSSSSPSSSSSSSSPLSSSSSPSSSSSSSVTSSCFLDKSRQTLKLQKKHFVSRDTAVFRFALPGGDSQQLGLPIGKHVKIFCPSPTERHEVGKWNGSEDKESGESELHRKYTPITSDDDGHLGYVDFLIKIYRGKEKEAFPDGGKASQYLDSLVPGRDTIELMGPVGLIQYLGCGCFSVTGRKQNLVKTYIGMIAGGTGITPMLQILKAILLNAVDRTQVSLLFANQTPTDILLKEELDSLAAAYPSQFTVWYTVDRLESNADKEGWKYSTGFVTEEMLREHLPAPSASTLILVCGPPPMCQFACKPNLEKLGFMKDDILQF